MNYQVVNKSLTIFRRLDMIWLLLIYKCVWDGYINNIIYLKKYICF